MSLPCRNGGAVSAPPLHLPTMAIRPNRLHYPYDGTNQPPAANGLDPQFRHIIDGEPLAVFDLVPEPELGTGVEGAGDSRCLGVLTVFIHPSTGEVAHPVNIEVYELAAGHPEANHVVLVP